MAETTSTAKGRWLVQAAAPEQRLEQRLQAIEFACSQQFLTSAHAYVARRPIPGPPLYRQALRAGRVLLGLDPSQAKAGPVGFLLFSRDGDALHIDELNVLPKWQGGGLASALMAALAEHASGLGLVRLTLTTFRDLPWNAPFYARRGFEAIAPEAGGPALQAEWQKLIDKKLDPATRVAMARSVSV